MIATFLIGSASTEAGRRASLVEQTIHFGTGVGGEVVPPFYRLREEEIGGIQREVHLPLTGVADHYPTRRAGKHRDRPAIVSAIEILVEQFDQLPHLVRPDYPAHDTGQGIRIL